MANTFRPYKIKTASGWDYNYFPGSLDRYAKLLLTSDIVINMGGALVNFQSATGDLIAEGIVSYASGVLTFNEAGTYLIFARWETGHYNEVQAATLDGTGVTQLAHNMLPRTGYSATATGFRIVTAAAGNTLKSAIYGSGANAVRIYANTQILIFKLSD